MGIIDYYNKYDEEKRLERKYSSELEFITTIEKLKDYISPKSKILELGAGTGKYSLYYNQLGNTVTAMDLVPKHIEVIDKKIEKNNLTNIDTYVGTATNLSNHPDETFDCVLCLGPLYHLKDKKDRESCIRECYRVLKPNGVIAIAYVNKHYIISRALVNSEDFLNKDFINKVLNNSSLVTEDNFWTESNFFNPDEIESLSSSFGFKKLHNIATDRLGRLLEDHLNRLSEDKFKVYLDYHLKNCENPYLLGYSNHGLYIGKK